MRGARYAATRECFEKSAIRDTAPHAQKKLIAEDPSRIKKNKKPRYQRVIHAYPAALAFVRVSSFRTCAVFFFSCSLERRRYTSQRLLAKHRRVSFCASEALASVLQTRYHLVAVDVVIDVSFVLSE